MKWNKWIVFLVSVCLLCTGCSYSSTQVTVPKEEKIQLTKTQKEFDDFLEEQMIETLTADYYTLHSYVEDPEALGIDESTVEKTFGRMDEASMEDNRLEIQETLDELQTFDKEDLTSSQQDTYDAFLFNMEVSQKLSDPKFDYLSSEFSPTNGIHVSFPMIFSDWELYSQKDVENLILMIEDVDDYTQSAIDYTWKQNEMGTMCIDFDSVISYCQQILEQGNESSSLNTLIKRVKELSLDTNLEKEYISRIQKAFNDSYLRSYQMILEAMTELEEKGENHPTGLANLPNGKEYYTYLMQSNTGRIQSVEDVEEKMNEAYQDHIFSFYNNYEETMDLFDMKTSYTSYEEILEDVKEQMFEDFPTISSLDYEIRDMEEDIATDNGMAAYYQIPTLDGNQKGQLRVNPHNNDISSVDTFMTVCHEGMPGHMYQYNYLHEATSQKIRWSLLRSIAYQEGYATYAEHYSLKYLKDIPQKTLKAYSSYSMFLYDALILADIGIHYYGWDIDTCNENMEMYGINLIQEQYDQLLYDACIFEPYYVGAYEFFTLQKKAQEKLGHSYDDREFHQAILSAGSLPFEIVERHVEDYISAQKK